MQKSQPAVFNAQCPSRTLLELLAQKWALLLIHTLAGGPRRTAELRREVGGISEKMLVQTLRTLERHGFIERHDYVEVPPRVEYRLTKLGSSLSRVVRAIDEWVEENLFDVLSAQRAFDVKKERAGKRLAGKLSRNAPSRIPPRASVACRKRDRAPLRLDASAGLLAGGTGLARRTRIRQIFDTRIGWLIRGRKDFPEGERALSLSVPSKVGRPINDGTLRSLFWPALLIVGETIGQLHPP